MKRNTFLVAANCLLLLFVCIGAGPGPVSAAESEGIDYTAYAATLKAYVDDNGLVDYKGLQENDKDLKAFLDSVAKLTPPAYDAMSNDEQLAFWINAYNALTLSVIIRDYPLSATSWLGSLRFPDNSVRHIVGLWDKLRFQVILRNVTLDEIEHDVLRPRYKEPRIHMALVCGAMGCPPLRNEPYTASKLDAQLDDQSRKFFANPSKFKIDKQANTVYLSKIFQWYGRDFVAKYGTEKGFSGHGEVERAVLNFACKYLPAADKEYLEKGSYTVAYQEYDWSLNEKKKP